MNPPRASLLVEPWVPLFVWLGAMAGGLLFFAGPPGTGVWAGLVLVCVVILGVFAQLPASRWRNLRIHQVWGFLGTIQGGKQGWSIESALEGFPITVNVGMEGVSVRITTVCRVSAFIGHGPVDRGGDERYEMVPGNIIADGDLGLGLLLGRVGVSGAVERLCGGEGERRVRLLLGRSSVQLLVSGLSLAQMQQEDAMQLLRALLVIVKAAERSPAPTTRAPRAPVTRERVGRMSV